MLISSILTYAQKRIEAHRRYRQAIAEIDSMTNADLIDLGVFKVDLYRAAREEYLGH